MSAGRVRPAHPERASQSPVTASSFVRPRPSTANDTSNPTPPPCQLPPVKNSSSLMLLYTPDGDARRRSHRYVQIRACR